MDNKIEQIKEILTQIGRGDIVSNCGDDDELVLSGTLDSMDLMAIVAKIEELKQDELDADLIEIENFASIKAMAEKLL